MVIGLTPERRPVELRQTDILIIGSGIAGLSLALKTADVGRVTILTKKGPSRGSTSLAQGGIAAVIDPVDSFTAHLEDTLEAGAGLCDRRAVEQIVRQGPERVRELIELGARFSREDDGTLELGREGGHSNRRIVHAGDYTGQEIQRALVEAAKDRPLELRDDSLATELIIGPGPGGRNHCYGVWSIEDGGIVGYLARVTVLATGGAGKVYLYTSNPDVATGDGIAMAYRAGCRVTNMEFVQFHPTCLYHPTERSFLITEALRGEGAVLLNTTGERFMPRYDERAELAPRDIVARAIDAEMKASGSKCVYLDATGLGRTELAERFPNVYGRTRELGYDIADNPFPVVPAAHYCCGGVQTDYDGRTDLPRLYALGECTFTGVHGANRLASNSLLEAVAYAHQAAADIRRRLGELEVPPDDFQPPEPPAVREPEELVTLDHDWDEARRLMWDYVGIVRSDERLHQAADRLRIITQHADSLSRRGYYCRDLIELRNILLVGQLIVQGALLRRESRGLHYNRDHPAVDDGREPKNTVLAQYGWRE
ncbi:MAG: L-aspartate oxidase [Candidatus Coatesbacteria bacterium]|nr:L-aspartate oxidase [Candidatus Coatesbacteria bacterium]